MLEYKSFGVNLGVVFAAEGANASGFGSQIQDRSRHVVDSLTMLIGRESAHIVVAEALRMNGALIANAERDKDGIFTDHGNLTLRVGALFVQHIYDYDKGITLGASVNFGQTKNKDGKAWESYVDVMPTFGGCRLLRPAIQLISWSTDL